MQNVFDVKAKFNVKERARRAQLENSHNAAPDKPSGAVDGKEVSAVVAKGQEVVHGTVTVQGKSVKGHMIDSHCQQRDAEMHAPSVRAISYGMLGVVKCNSLFLMH